MSERPTDPTGKGESRSGLTRRELIQRSAVVGGVLWVAPVIDSFASPASAITVAGSPPPCRCGDPASGTLSPAFNGSTVTVSVVGFQGPCIGCRQNVLTYKWTVGADSTGISWGPLNQPTLVGTKTGSPARATLSVVVTGDCGGTTCPVDPTEEIIFPGS